MNHNLNNEEGVYNGKTLCADISAEQSIAGMNMMEKLAKSIKKGAVKAALPLG